MKMRSVKINITHLIVTLSAFIATGIVLFGLYWLAKNGSYWLWYEDMVKDTIREMVKQEALRQ